MSVIRELRLECTTGNSNKFYNVFIVKNGTSYDVTTWYGAIGRPPKNGSSKFGLNLANAHDEADKISKEKIKKGYVLVSDTASIDESTSRPMPVTSKPKKQSQSQKSVLKPVLNCRHSDTDSLSLWF